ncbi:hypothetical protein D3C75_688560 [compost metagenome]
MGILQQIIQQGCSHQQGAVQQQKGYIFLQAMCLGDGIQQLLEHTDSHCTQELGHHTHENIEKDSPFEHKQDVF